MPRTVEVKEHGRIEVAAPRNGRPGFRWTTGWVVVVDGRAQLPPLPRLEALRFAKRIRAETT